MGHIFPDECWQNIIVGITFGLNNVKFETRIDIVTRFVEIAKKWPDFEKERCRTHVFFLELNFGTLIFFMYVTF